MRGEDGSTDLEERHELREAIIEAFDENTSDSESEITPRPQPLRSRRVTAASRSPRAPASDKGLSDTRTTLNGTRLIRGVVEGLPSPLSSTDSSFLSIHPLGSTSCHGGSPEPAWSIHYSQPPASSVFRPTLVTYACLMKHDISREQMVGLFTVQFYLTGKSMLMQIEALERYAAIIQIVVLDDVFLRQPSSNIEFLFVPSYLSCYGISVLSDISRGTSQKLYPRLGS